MNLFTDTSRTVSTFVITVRCFHKKQNTNNNDDDNDDDDDNNVDGAVIVTH